MFRLSILSMNCLASLVLLTAIGSAQDGVDPSKSQGSVVEERELIQELGDHSYYVREKATRALIGRGADVKGLLTEALTDTNVEIRLRALQILNRVRENEDKAMLAAFVAGFNGSDKDEMDLPGWKRFRELVGDDRDVRKLFIKMLRSNRALLSAYAQGSPELPGLIRARITSIEKVIEFPNRPSPLIIPRETIASLLLVGTDRTSHKNIVEFRASLSHLHDLLSDSSVKSAIHASVHAPVLRRLIDAWVAAASTNGSCMSVMTAMSYELRETSLQLARKYLKKRLDSSKARQLYAVNALGLFGVKEDASLLLPLLGDSGFAANYSEGKIEVRDAALAVSLILAGKLPKDYGFKMLRDEPDETDRLISLGFTDDATREAAHARWATERCNSISSPASHSIPEIPSL